MLRTSGLLRTARRSSLTFRTIGSGVPKVATIASQPADVKFGMVSAAAGGCGEFRKARRGAHGQPVQFSGLHGADQRCTTFDEHLHTTTHQVAHRLCRAARIRNHQELDVGAALDHLAGEMALPAATDTA